MPLLIDRNSQANDWFLLKQKMGFAWVIPSKVLQSFCNLCKLQNNKYKLFKQLQIFAMITFYVSFTFTLVKIQKRYVLQPYWIYITTSNEMLLPYSSTSIWWINERLQTTDTYVCHICICKWEIHMIYNIYIYFFLWIKYPELKQFFQCALAVLAIKLTIHPQTTSVLFNTEVRIT